MMMTTIKKDIPKFNMKGTIKLTKQYDCNTHTTRAALKKCRYATRA